MGLHGGWSEDLGSATRTKCVVWSVEVRQMAEASTHGLDTGVSARYGMPGQTTTAAIQACLQTGMSTCPAADIDCSVSQ